MKITPIGESSQIIEFNITLPSEANVSIAPISTLIATQRWAAMATNNGEYTQITKLDLIHTLQYTDCKGNVRVLTNTGSTIIALAPTTSATIVPANVKIDKAVDIIIPNGISIINQNSLNELPTSLPVKGSCAYSVFELHIPTTTPVP